MITATTLTTEVTIDGKIFHVAFNPSESDLMLMDFSDARAEDGTCTHTIIDGAKELYNKILEGFGEVDYVYESCQPCVSDRQLSEGFREYCDDFVRENKHNIIAL